MDATEPPSDDIAEMLRDSLRGFLKAHWTMGVGREPTSPDEISAIWGKLVRQGVAALGSDRDEGGLREVLVVMAELGRAACPAPMWSAALANLALSGSQAAAAVDVLEKLHAGTEVAAFSSAPAIPMQAQARSSLTVPRAFRMDASCRTTAGKVVVRR